jgi:hypothetical protein
MNTVVSEFLALRRAHQQEGRQHQDDQADVNKPDGTVTASRSVQNNPSDSLGTVPRTDVQETELTDYLSDVLAAHPAARIINNRAAVAEYLASSVIHKYGDPRQVSWRCGNPVSYHNRSNIPWRALCPAGHPTDEALETNQVVGWVCEQCEKVYDARECRVVSR